MSFKENLLKKIEIERKTQVALASIGTPDSDRKLDKEAVRWMLEVAGYRHRQVRDLDLYMQPQTLEAGRGRILVLDNELKVYDTTVEDVAMRKSPIVKEMLNIRNAIRILNDKDVAVSRKADTLKALHDECVGALDLRFAPGDLTALSADGRAALEREQAEAVVECLDLFAELLGYGPPPRAFRLNRHHIVCDRGEGSGGEVVCGPLAVYSLLHNGLKFIDMKIGVFDKAKIAVFEDIAAGRAKASVEGPEVFEALRQRVGDYPPHR